MYSCNVVKWTLYKSKHIRADDALVGYRSFHTMAAAQQKNPTSHIWEVPRHGSDGCCTNDGLSSTRGLRGSSDLRTWWLQVLQSGLPRQTFIVLLERNSQGSQAMMWETTEPPVLYLLLLKNTFFELNQAHLPCHISNHYTTMLFVSQGDSVMHFIAKATLTSYVNCN